MTERYSGHFKPKGTRSKCLRRTDKMGISDRVNGDSLESKGQEKKGPRATNTRTLRICGAQIYQIPKLCE
jgi:hypothetical protein